MPLVVGSSPTLSTIYRQVTQLVEFLSDMEAVVGSSPTLSTKNYVL